jgi:hypothetical protein
VPIKIFFFSILTFLSTLVDAQTKFADVSESAGIDHEFQVLEGMFGGGACVFDFDNDGFEDVFITSGMKEDMLYKNNGDGTFKNVYVGSGLEASRVFVTQGAVSADVNRDGFRDLLITTITTKKEKKVIPRASNLLFLNNGDGTFRDVSKEYGFHERKTFSTAASFGDFNADGYPDLYIGNYFNEFKGELNSISDATIVGANQIAEGNLLMNMGGKYFKDVYNDYGLSHRGFGFGGIFTDFDNDQDQDIFVNHDFGYKRTPDLLLENKFPKKAFEDVAEKLKIDLKINSMGTAVGDYNNDGLMDYYMTNIRFNYFMVNKGSGKGFENMAKPLGMYYFAISWGANFADFDHDGDVDLFVANGDLNPNCQPMANFYFENSNGKFQEIASQNGLNGYELGRGSVVFDYDNDGDLDILVVNQVPVLDYPILSKTKLYRNDSTNGNWIKISLKGTQAELAGIGSKIEVIAGGQKMIREIDGGASSHLSQNSILAHFGLRQAKQIDTLRVFWTGGEIQEMYNVGINQLLAIEEPIVEKSKLSFSLYLMISIIVIGLVLIYLSKRKNKLMNS